LSVHKQTENGIFVVDNENWCQTFGVANTAPAAPNALAAVAVYKLLSHTVRTVTRLLWLPSTGAVIKGLVVRTEWSAVQL